MPAPAFAGMTGVTSEVLCNVRVNRAALRKECQRQMASHGGLPVTIKIPDEKAFSILGRGGTKEKESPTDLVGSSTHDSQGQRKEVYVERHHRLTCCREFKVRQ
jgi:hypothetical protein